MKVLLHLLVENDHLNTEHSIWIDTTNNLWHEKICREKNGELLGGEKTCLDTNERITVLSKFYQG